MQGDHRAPTPVKLLAICAAMPLMLAGCGLAMGLELDGYSGRDASLSETGAGGTSAGGSGNGGGGTGQGGSTPDSGEPDASGAEDCTNGTDDDGDGLVDCADTQDCAALVTCLSPVPVGWEGYFAMYFGAPAALPSCAAPFSTPGLFAGRLPTAAPATCSACSCGAPSAITCGEPVVNVYTATQCGSGSFWGIGSLDPYGTCKSGSFPGPQPPMSASLAMPSPVGGTCATSPPTKTVTDPTWGDVSFGCQATEGGGCGTGLTCVPRPAGPFHPTVCIYKAEVVSVCPPPFSNRQVYYVQWDDQRACSACVCTVSGADCKGTLIMATSSACPTSGGDAKLALSTAGCQDITNPLQGNGPYNYWIEWEESPPTGGSCSPSGGTPVGSVEINPDSAYTVCCAP
jgi:hypothetical protein